MQFIQSIDQTPADPGIDLRGVNLPDVHLDFSDDMFAEHPDVIAAVDAHRVYAFSATEKDAPPRRWLKHLSPFGLFTSGRVSVAALFGHEPGGVVVDHLRYQFFTATLSVGIA